VNDPTELGRALAADVDYVTTDRPDLALGLRRARP
jgi:glycerophosphoryl diester phosphodiesterase